MNDKYHEDYYSRTDMRGAIVEYHPQNFPEGVQSNGAIAFLDRDGVLNIGRAGYVNNTEQMVKLQNAGKVVGDLRRLGFRVCVVTNQSALMRGLWGTDTLIEIHNHLRQQLLEEDNDAHLDVIITCPHRNIDRCNCRKPMPGMLQIGDAIFRKELPIIVGLNSEIDASDDYPKINWWKDKPKPSHDNDLIVGDRKSDLGAGWAMGLRLFKVPEQVGIDYVSDRVTDFDDKGDAFQPVR